jgi:microsomal dipeptidase-like Zn-dependent dipeptidase
MGVDSVVLGPDFIDYALPELMLEVARHPNLYDVDVQYAEGVETVRSMQNTVAAMAERGLDAAVIDKIGRSNFLRLFEKTQSLARVSAPTG